MSTPEEITPVEITPEQIAGALALVADLPADCAVSHAQFQAAFAAMVRMFGQRADNDRALLPVAGPDACTATDVMLTVTSLMRALNLQFFELGMWQALTARH